MSEWLDLMLDEVRRKQKEAREAREEMDRRRAEQADARRKDAAAQSK